MMGMKTLVSQMQNSDGQKEVNSGVSVNMQNEITTAAKDVSLQTF